MKVYAQTSRDHVKYWCQKYRESTDMQYMVQWGLEGGRMKKLMGLMSDKKIRALIDFAFSGDPMTAYLRQQGFPIALFVSQVNKYQVARTNPGISIPEWELNLDIPVWDDKRTSYLWNRIKDSDMDSILKHIIKKEAWLILMAKLDRQKGFIPEKVKWFYEKWRMKEPIKREAIK